MFRCLKVVPLIEFFVISSLNILLHTLGHLSYVIYLKVTCVAPPITNEFLSVYFFCDTRLIAHIFPGPPVLAESIMGTVGRLPCNVTPPIYEDRVALVIWYKVGLKTPIYR